jgi:hypothetical protein
MTQSRQITASMLHICMYVCIYVCSMYVCMYVYCKSNMKNSILYSTHLPTSRSVHWHMYLVTALTRSKEIHQMSFVNVHTHLWTWSVLTVCMISGAQWEDLHGYMYLLHAWANKTGIPSFFKKKSIVAIRKVTQVSLYVYRCLYMYRCLRVYVHCYVHASRLYSSTLFPGLSFPSFPSTYSHELPLFVWTPFLRLTAQIVTLTFNVCAGGHPTRI